MPLEFVRTYNEIYFAYRFEDLLSLFEEKTLLELIKVFRELEKENRNKDNIFFYLFAKRLEDRKGIPNIYCGIWDVKVDSFVAFERVEKVLNAFASYDSDEQNKLTEQEESSEMIEDFNLKSVEDVTQSIRNKVRPSDFNIYKDFVKF